MNRRTYRRTWLKMHRSYEKRIYRIFIREIKRLAKNIPLDNITKDTYEAIVRNAIPENAFQQTYYDAYYQVGLIHGKRVVYGVQKETKNAAIDAFANFFRRTLGKWLIDKKLKQIVIVRGSLVDYIIQAIADGFEANTDIPTITRDIYKLIRSRGFYRWQARRIARTEATGAANYATSVSHRTSNLVLEKEWISSNDKRTRRDIGDLDPKKYDHIDINGQKVGQDEDFNVQGDMIGFPGDPKGQAGNIINCRCTMALVPKRDADGRLVRKQ